MSGRQRRTGRDHRRRALGQNFLADGDLAERLVSSLGVAPGELVVDLGAGTGALTVPLARAGAQVWAVEADPIWAERLSATLRREGVAGSVRVIKADLRRLRLPTSPYRVAANPPFALTTEILAKLLDEPARGPSAADLLLQREVARKHATSPPTTLRTAAWSPWWTFELGPVVGRGAFRPRPAVDAAVLRIRRRTPPVLPPALAPGFRETLRPAWNDRQP